MLFISTILATLKGSSLFISWLNVSPYLFCIYLFKYLPETAFSANSEEHDQKHPNFAGTLMKGD